MMPKSTATVPGVGSPAPRRSGCSRGFVQGPAGARGRNPRGSRGIVRGLLALTILAPTFGSAAAQERMETVSLRQAVERAMLHSPQLAQTQANVTNAGSSRRRALGSFLPNISVSSGASVNSSSRFDPNTQRVVEGSSDSYNAGINANYQIFQGGRKYHELGRTASAQLEAEARLQSQRFSVMLQTTTLFMNALRQSELVQVAEASLDRARESLDITRARMKGGAATRSDTLRTRLELANARQSLLQSRNQLRATRFALGRQVGANGPVVPIAPDDLAPTPLALSEADILALAESRSPSVRAAEAAAEVANSSVSNARSSYLPSLSASSSYSWANQEPSLDQGRTSWSFRISGSYQLFDGFAREQSLGQASESRRVARLTEDDARRAVRQEVDAALRTLETQELAIAIAEEALAVAQEDLRLNRVRYDARAGNILDVIISQVALDQAEANLVSARYDYALARAELESIIGREL